MIGMPTDLDVTLTGIFILSNLVIVGGYVFIGVRVVPAATVRLRRTRIGGIGFFLLCAGTHLHMAWHAFTDPDYAAHATTWHVLGIHVVQAAAVWAFVIGLYIEAGRWGPWAAGGANHATPHPEKGNPR